MIRFKAIRWQNFISYGNQWTEIKLNNTAKTLIVGESGAGKSVLIDAISFALFGVPFRKINKPLLVNSYTDKNMLVEIEFTIGKREYLIRRGMKPVVFEIYEDDEMLKQDSMARDYQSVLENTILKVNFKSFSQIILLATASYVPFMELTALGRRSVIEDLLDLQVFSSMNTLLKDRVADNKESLGALDQDIRLLESNLELHESHLKEVQTDIEERTIDLQAKILERQTERLRLVNAKEALKQEDGKQQQIKEHINKKWAKKRDDLNTFIAKARSKIKSLEKQRDFYLHTDQCSTCGQGISELFKGEKTSSLSNSIQTFTNQIDEASARLVSIGEVYKDYERAEEEQKRIMLELNKLNLEMVALDTLLKNDKIALESLKKTYEKVDTSRREEFQTKLEVTKCDRKKILEQREVLSVASTLLKDGGIKTLIIKQYIPIINKVINQYLGQMNLFIDFNLDENFDEVIKARYREDNSYFSFSEGEKKRINLAIMFAWRAIAKIRNTANTNLLIFDEILDSALDANGREDFMTIIGNMQDTNIFIISHNTDNLTDKFDLTIRFKMIKHFSQMEQV